MIAYTTGDLLSDSAEALVNTVNCVGVMGRGIALQFKKQFPDNFTAYEQACKADKIKLGKMFIWENQSIFGKSYIINFPTKSHWRKKSQLTDIANGLDDLVKIIKQYQIKSIAIPPLGSGLGGLDWNQVKLLIEEKLISLNEVKIIVYEPSAIAEKKRIASQAAPNITPGRAALLGINYTKNTYGPYAENLRHVMHKLEGHYIQGYQDGGDEPNKPLKIIGNAQAQAANFLQQKPSTLKNLERVAELVDGFETSSGLELLSTVHWLAKENTEATVKELTHQTHAWSERKQRFTIGQIEIAHNALLQKGWLVN